MFILDASAIHNVASTNAVHFATSRWCKTSLATDGPSMRQPLTMRFLRLVDLRCRAASSMIGNRIALRRDPEAEFFATGLPTRGDPGAEILSV